MACEACNTKFNFFTRKKQCMDCLRYFCSECIIRRLDKMLSCDSCCILSRRPLIRSLIVQMRSKDLRQYLSAKKVPIKGCIEKEDLIKLLVLYANGTDWNVGNTDNINSSSSDQSSTRNHEHSTQNQTRETGTTTILPSEIQGTNPRVHYYSEESAENVHSEEGRILNIPDIHHLDTFSPVKLSEINTSSELEQLSVKQLKNLLATNRVNYKGCIERHELLNKATKLWEDYKQSRTKLEIPDENICKICWDDPIECVILECGHMACCLNCGKQMSECPICKQYVVRVVRFFKS